MVSGMTKELKLETLAAEIRAEHTKATASAINALEHAIIAGRLLVQAKAAVAHGEWLPWLAANCPDISARSVQGYIRLAKNAPALLADPNTQRVSHLGVREALNMVADHRPTSADAPGPDLTEPTIERDGFELHDDQFLVGVKLTDRGRQRIGLYIFPYSEPGFFYVTREDMNNALNPLPPRYDPGAHSSVEGTEKPVCRAAVRFVLQSLRVGDTKEFKWKAWATQGFDYNLFLYSSHEDYVDKAILGR